MGMKEQILDKIKRNLDILGIAAKRNASDVELIASVRKISYVEADHALPLGGIDDSVSPFLGIKHANPGKLKLKGAAGENSIAAIMADAETLRAFNLMCGFANDKSIEAGDTATELALIEGHSDLIGMGE